MKKNEPADAGAPQERAGTCPHETGRYWRATLICDRCGERVGDHYVHGMDGLRWNLRWIAIGHPDWKDNTDNTEVPAIPAHQERTEPLTPEQLDAECHCGKDQDGCWVFGVYCPIIEHRARSGARWRQAYLEIYNEQLYGVGAPARAAEWQPIEGAPKDGTPVWLIEDGSPLGLTAAHQFVGVWIPDKRYTAGGAWLASDRDYIGQPIAWMPLPLPPCALTGNSKSMKT